MAWNNVVKYKTEMCDQMVELMKYGATVKEVSEALDIHFTTLHEWKKTYPEFNKAYQRGKQLAENFYTRMGLDNICNKDFNFKLYRLIGRNRFGWADSRKVKVPGFDKAAKHTDQIGLISALVAQGEITPDEAGKLATMVATSANVQKITEFEERLEAVEKRLEGV